MSESRHTAEQLEAACLALTRMKARMTIEVGEGRNESAWGADENESIAGALISIAEQAGAECAGGGECMGWGVSGWTCRVCDWTSWRARPLHRDCIRSHVALLMVAPSEWVLSGAGVCVWCFGRRGHAHT
jgi:hypothetical protein